MGEGFYQGPEGGGGAWRRFVQGRPHPPKAPHDPPLTDTDAGPSDRGEGIEPRNVDCFLSKIDAKQWINGGPPPLPWRNPWSIETSLRHARNGQRPAPIGRDR